ncbi:hypothetical protein RRG08_007953 [Elysia crispata]|uniref:Uncharacterized protein n=1 Tax=Elysia crispata TaxID=231223 RepID=A0AAE0ZR08_9GAST|nr:hypothetical protein RRG08_007953 [Elysia crispata]
MLIVASEERSPSLRCLIAQRIVFLVGSLREYNTLRQPTADEEIRENLEQTCVSMLDRIKSRENNDENISTSRHNSQMAKPEIGSSRGAGRICPPEAPPISRDRV